MNKNFTITNFRSRNIKDSVLLTDDTGSHCFLTKKEFSLVLSEKIEDDLLDKLDKAGFIIKNNDATKQIMRYRGKNSFLFCGTSLHIVVPTLRCNLDCIYCHASKKGFGEKGYDMTKETAKNTVDFIFQSPSNAITIEFQGGEPLLNFDIVKYIIEYAKEKNKKEKKELRFSLVTNLILMTDEKLDYLIKKSIDICTSLDGPEFLHNKNRPKNSHQITVKWIKKIQEEYKKRKIKNKRINALLTTTKDSLKHAEEIIDEYIRLGINIIHLRFLNNLGDARPEWKDIGYTSEEFMVFWKKAVNYINKLNKNSKKHVIKERMHEIIDVKVTKDYDPGYLDLRSPCGAVIGQMTYDYNGKIYSCDEGRMIGEDLFVVGDVNKDKYREVTTSPHTCGLIMASTNDTQICDACAYKPYCGICPVCNYAEQGNIIAKIPETNRCKIFKAQFDWYFENTLRNKN